MKCIISIKNTSCPWTDSIAPSSSPYLLKIANKPWGEYLVDFCFTSSIKQVRILLDEAGHEVEKYFSDGMKWGVDISYGFIRDSDGIGDILMKNMGFAAGEDLLIINGPVFIDYSVKAGKYKFFDGTNIELCSDNGIGRLILSRSDRNGEFVAPIRKISEEQAGFGIRTLCSVKDFFVLNMSILEGQAGSFVLPGYNNEDNIYIGQNVSISRTARIEKPVMIGDNVEINGLCVIGGNSILGSNVIIDGRTVIENSVVCDGSYVGLDLEISGKVIHQCRLIDPETGEALVLTDKFILSGEAISEILMKIKRLRSFFTASLMLLATIPFYLLFILYFSLFKRISPSFLEYFSADRKSSCKVKIFGSSTGIAANLFKRFALDKVPLLVEVLKGNIFIAGNSLVKISARGGEIIGSLPIYLPGAFSYGESLPENGSESERMIHDMYYSHKASLFLDVKIVINILLKRLMGDFSKGDDGSEDEK